jgi:hypothetical protein
MIYSNILNPKFRDLLRGFVLVLVSIFTMSLYSCQTTYTETYTPEQLRADEESKEAKVIYAKTNSDSTINLEYCNAKYDKNVDNLKDVISYLIKDTISIKKEPVNEYKIRIRTSEINLQNIMSANIEKTKTNIPLTILIISAIIALPIIIFCNLKI